MNTENIENDNDIPVTSIIRRLVRNGREQDYELWSRNIASACQEFDGYLGIRIIHPASPSEEHVSIISFNNYQNYQAWLNSEVRNTWLQQVNDLTEGIESTEQITGFDYWLGKETDTGKSWLSELKMTIVAYIAIWPLIYFISPLLRPLMPSHPILASLISTAVLTLMMGYLTLPVATRIFRGWLVKNGNR